ncbi:MAG: antitoxin [Thermoleophilaceae bacterium]|nr:antitoxin [Thermoleophilaceae bacterium]
MRTTVTLDADVAAAVKRLQRERGVPFKRALNDALRAGLSGPSERVPFGAFDMGLRPGVDLDKALRLAGELEDADLVTRLRARK